MQSAFTLKQHAFGGHLLLLSRLLPGTLMRNSFGCCLQVSELRASITEVVGPQLFRLGFAYGAAVLVVQGGPAFQRSLAMCQPELLRLGRRVGITVQLLTTSSAQHTQVHGLSMVASISHRLYLTCDIAAGAWQFSCCNTQHGPS